MSLWPNNNISYNNLQTVNLLHVNKMTHTPKRASHSHQLFHTACEKRPVFLWVQCHHWSVISPGQNSEGNKQTSNLVVLKPDHYVTPALCPVHAAVACPGVFSAFCWPSTQTMPGLLRISLVSFSFENSMIDKWTQCRHFLKKSMLLSDLSFAHPVQNSCAVSALERWLSRSLRLFSKQTTEEEAVSVCSLLKAVNPLVHYSLYSISPCNVFLFVYLYYCIFHRSVCVYVW